MANSEVRVAALDVLAVFMHPNDDRFDEVREAIERRLTVLVADGFPPGISGSRSSDDHEGA
jgi:hypothetical protein